MEMVSKAHVIGFLAGIAAVYAYNHFMARKPKAQ